MMDRAEFLKRAAGAAVLASTGALPAAARTPGLTYRGVTYDTGTLTLGDTTLHLPRRTPPRRQRL